MTGYHSVFSTSWPQFRLQSDVTRGKGLTLRARCLRPSPALLLHLSRNISEGTWHGGQADDNRHCLVRHRPLFLGEARAVGVLTPRDSGGTCLRAELGVQTSHPALLRAPVSRSIKLSEEHQNLSAGQQMPHQQINVQDMIKVTCYNIHVLLHKSLQLQTAAKSVTVSLTDTKDRDAIAFMIWMNF